MGTIADKLSRMMDMKARLMAFADDSECRKELGSEDLVRLYSEISSLSRTEKLILSKTISELNNEANDWWLEAPSKLNPL